MSYLLDALKKAESERERLKVDGIIHYPVIDKTTGMPLWLSVVVVVFILISLFSLLPVFEMKPETYDVAQSTLARQAIQSDAIFSEDLLGSSIASQDQITTGSDESVPVAGIHDSAVTNSQSKIYELTELPADILQRIPSISLESHIYSSNPDYRSVIINGSPYTQNMFIGNQVVLTEISSQGIIIKVADYSISLPKGITWVASNRVK